MDPTTKCSVCKRDAKPGETFPQFEVNEIEPDGEVIGLVCDFCPECAAKVRTCNECGVVLGPDNPGSACPLCQEES